MHPKFRFALVLEGIILVLIVSLSTSNLTLAKGDDAHLPSNQENSVLPAKSSAELHAGGAGFQIISSHDFQPVSSSYQYYYYYHLLQNSGTSTLYVNGAVKIPHGVTITKVAVNIFDNDDNNITSRLYKCPYLWDITTDCLQMAYANSSGLDGPVTFDMGTIEESVVDNANYAYWIEVAIPVPSTGNIGLTGVRIDYFYPVYLPSINR